MLWLTWESWSGGGRKTRELQPAHVVMKRDAGRVGGGERMWSEEGMRVRGAGEEIGVSFVVGVTWHRACQHDRTERPHRTRTHDFYDGVGLGG